MTVAEAKELLTPELISSVIDDKLIDRSTHHYYAISVKGKLLELGNGRLLFNSRQQAVKGFYNSFRWRVGYNVGRRLFGPGHRWWETSGSLWRAFTEKLKEDCGFQIVEI